MNTNQTQPRRTIKSFVRRHRHLTAHQEKLFKEHRAEFEVDDSFRTRAQAQGNLILEIGFGDGHSLWQMAQQHPDCHYIGVEVHAPGIASLMQNLLEHSITNVKIFNGDAVEFLKNQIADQSLSRVQIFFPDPWHKLKHHKRRLIQPEFVDLLKQKLRVGGVIHCATDWEGYAKHMMKVLSEAPGLQNSVGERQFADNSTNQLRPTTKFERRGLKLGHATWDLLFSLRVS